MEGKLGTRRLSSPHKFQVSNVCKSPREMNPRFARSTHSQMSTNILDHVRPLAILLEANFQNRDSRRATAAPPKARR